MRSDWLHPAQISCPSCSAALFTVDRSPFYDDWVLYCDRCPRRAEVSFYDPVVVALGNVSAAERFGEIERRLRPCACGGRYLFSAPRRCVTCSCVVLDGRAYVDIWPAVYSIPDDRDPTEAEEREVVAFEDKFIQRLNLW